MKRLLPLLLLAACANGETAPPPPEPLATPLTTVSTPGSEIRREKTAELTCFPELPPGAEPALLAIRTAAEAGDLQALRGWLSERINWSFGGEAGAERAIQHWRQRPELLRELVTTLDRGCLEDESRQRVVCPPEYRHEPGYLGWRAGIERQPQGWRLAFFVAGD